MLFFYFQGKIQLWQSIWLIWLSWFFLFSSVILLSKMKSLFFNLFTSPSVTNLFIDYDGKYELIYSFKDLRS